MKVVVEIEIAKPREDIWSAITDIGNCARMISAIIDLEILNQPEEGIVGLKWKETRLMFGKQASETMWITESVENEYYCTRAESHGSIYITRLSLSERGNNTLLTMSFTGESQTLMVKIISACMGVFIKSAMKKALLKDLEDIKKYVEQIQ
jgi:carbon monoxide dehydrogenase subunit G